MSSDGGPETPRPTVSAMKVIASEPAIYGVVLVAGLVVIMNSSEKASWEILIKVVATLVAFWAAHVYASVVSHLGDHPDTETPIRSRLSGAMQHAIWRSSGMLLGGALPLGVLTLGALKLISDRSAIWGTLWAAVLILGCLGFIGVASWTRRVSAGLVGALITSLLGLALVGLKILVK